MTLTNYVLQSLIFFVIFATFELLPYDSFDPDDRLLWAIVIGLRQIGFSVAWFKRFSMGPLEAVWRKLASPGPLRQETKPA